MKGFLDSTADSRDEDWFCTPAGLALASVQVSGISGIDVELVVSDGKTQPRTVNAAMVGLGEQTTFSGGTGPVCVAVRATKAPSASAST